MAGILSLYKRYVNSMYTFLFLGGSGNLLGCDVSAIAKKMSKRRTSRISEYLLDFV